MITRLLKKWYGDFSRDELLRTLLLGAAFTLIIGTYWTMRPLKDALFNAIVIGASRQAIVIEANQEADEIEESQEADEIKENQEADEIGERQQANVIGKSQQANVIGKSQQANVSLLAWAKIVSLFVLVPVTLLYSRLVDWVRRNQLFYLLGGLASVGLVIFSLVFADSDWGLPNKDASPYRLLGWSWYVFVEVYGSLLIALFWAYCTEVIDAEIAKRSFPLIVLLGQIGGMIGPQSTKLPAMLGFQTSAPLVAACGVGTLAAVLMIHLFATRLACNHASRDAVPPADLKPNAETQPGFLTGLKILVKDPYLLCIFAVIAIYEIVVTIFDFNFKRLVFITATGDQETAALLGNFGSAVNAVSFLCLACGISNIQRRLGMRVTLCAMPFIIGAMVLAFNTSPTLRVLFWIMVAGKAINYALNSPSIKQLYIPTSLDAKYKSQAWIEMFGARGAKAGGSGVNTLLKVFQAHAATPAAGITMYILFASAFSSVLLVGWFFAAWFLAGVYDRRVANAAIPTAVPTIGEG